MYKQKYVHVEDVWDRTKSRLSIQVVGAKGLSITGKDSTYCRLVWGKKTSFKTTTAKKSQQPQWNDITVLPIDRSEDLVLECYQKKKLGRDQLLGMGMVLGRDRWTGDMLEEERVYDVTVDINPQLGRTRDVRGKVAVRYVYSTLSETRPRQDIGQNVFFYDDHISRFKTGDLVVYSSVGLLDTCSKLASATDYARVGMIVKLANKWTRREDLYILEVTRNIDNFVDAFVEKPKHGVALFRFFERIHHVHATKVWWAPIADDVNTAKLIPWMWSLHAADGVFLSQVSLPKAWAEVLDLFGLSKAAQNKGELLDLLGPRLIQMGLTECGVKTKLPEDRPLLAAEVCRLPCFADPVLLRDVDMSTPAADLDLPDQYFYVDGKPPGGIAGSRVGTSEATLPTDDSPEAPNAAAAAAPPAMQPMFVIGPDGQPMQVDPGSQFIMTAQGPVPILASSQQPMMIPGGSMPMMLGPDGQPMGPPLVVGQDGSLQGMPAPPSQAKPMPTPVPQQLDYDSDSSDDSPPNLNPTVPIEPNQQFIGTPMIINPDGTLAMPQQQQPPQQPPQDNRPAGAVSMAGLQRVIKPQ